VVLILAAAAVAALALTPAIRAQSAATSTDTPKFEVDSVKLVKDCGEPVAVDGPDKKQKGVRKGGIRAVSPGRLHVCSTVGELIHDGYVVYADRHRPAPRAIEGGPAWIDADLYDINAKADGSARQETMMGPMLRALLEERFQLKIRGETRDVPVYALTVAKSGLKLQRTPKGSCTPVEAGKPLPPRAPGEKPACGSRSLNGKTGAAHLDMVGTSMTGFCGILCGLVLDRTVTDQTGIAGMFDFHLEFGLDSPGLKLHVPAAAASDEPGGPSIFAAVEKQLGLKLEPAKSPGEFLVIDRLERPSGN